MIMIRISFLAILSVSAAAVALVVATTFIVPKITRAEVPGATTTVATSSAPEQTGLRLAEAASAAQAGPTQNDLETLIRAKSEELQKINQRLETTTSNLQSTKEQKASLERELRKLQSNVDQLELNIRADEIATQKLGLEIDSVQYDIRDIEIGVKEKADAIAHVLRTLQKNDTANVLFVFLRNNSLADGFWESQSLKNFRTQLALDISNLTALQERLRDKVRSVSMKKEDVEAHQKNLSARKIIVQDQKEERKIILAQTKNKESVYAQQVSELKKQQDDISDEIAKIEDQLRASFDSSLLPIPRAGFLTWPVTLAADLGKGIVTQHFGEVSRLYRGRPHNGLDIGAPIGTPVLAADDGVVTAVDNNDRSKWSKYQYGKYILVRHPTNLTTLYGHLSSQVVKDGQEVKRGDIIGYVGSTGYATGPHLHFGLYWAPSVLMKSVPPAAGLVPVGVAIAPEGYL